MPMFWMITCITLCPTVLGIGFLVIRNRRLPCFPRWRGRLTAAMHAGNDCDSGDTPGEQAPDFTLQRVGGGRCSLSDFAGRRVLLVFADADGPAADDIAPELNRLQRSGKLPVLVIQRSAAYQAALWTDDVLAAFPVLVLSDTELATDYDVSDTPFAFVIDEQRRIAAAGIIDRQQSLTSLIRALDSRSVGWKSTTARRFRASVARFRDYVTLNLGMLLGSARTLLSQS